MGGFGRGLIWSTAEVGDLLGASGVGYAEVGGLQVGDERATIIEGSDIEGEQLRGNSSTEQQENGDDSGEHRPRE